MYFSISGNLFQIPSLYYKSKIDKQHMKIEKLEKMKEFRDPILNYAHQFQRTILHAIVKKGDIPEHIPYYLVYSFISF
eukprot:UN26629